LVSLKTWGLWHTYSNPWKKYFPLQGAIHTLFVKGPATVQQIQDMYIYCLYFEPDTRISISLVGEKIHCLGFGFTNEKSWSVCFNQVSRNNPVYSSHTDYSRFFFFSELQPYLSFSLLQFHRKSVSELQSSVSPVCLNKKLFLFFFLQYSQLTTRKSQSTGVS
jgi:hypothetical protein